MYPYNHYQPVPFSISNPIPQQYVAQNYNFHITRVDNRPVMNSIKLPSISSFSNFRKPIVYKPISTLTSKEIKPNIKITKPSAKHEIKPPKRELTVKQKIEIETRIIEELKQELFNKSLLLDHQAANNSFKVLKFKPPNYFLDKIKVDDLFISRFVFQDPEISPSLDINCKDVQTVKLNKRKILEYKILEFLFEILKFNDKTKIDQSKILNNFPINHLYLTVTFDLNDIDPLKDILTSQLRYLTLDLKLLKTTNSKINVDKIKQELIKIFGKFMPADPMAKFNYQTNRPCWRLGAKDELSILKMEIKYGY